jgi:succinoglycan biosynthesis transport protein ExoP
MRGEMNFYTVLRVLRASWVLLLVGALLGAGAGYAYAVRGGPQYVARAQIFAAVSASGSAGELAAGSSYMKLQVRSYPALVTSERVLGEVAKSTGIDPVALAARVTVDVPSDSMWLVVNVTDSSPEQARSLADALATKTKSEVETLEMRGKSTAPVTLTVVTPADAPVQPVARGVTTAVVGGTVAGLVLAFLLGLFGWVVREGSRSARRR